MDRGIAKVAEKKGIDVLVIEEDAILLPGFKNGFIGGSTGLIDKEKWLWQAICESFGPVRQ